MAVYLLIQNKRFRKRAPNLIISHLLLSDSISALLGIYRSYLTSCTKIKFIECSLVIFPARTFGYTSTAFLLFFAIDRYIKVTKRPLQYNRLMNYKNLRIGISSVWILSIIFSIITTPYWIKLTIPKERNTSFSGCYYSIAMEPVTGLITIIICQFFSIILLIAINVIFVIEVRKKIIQTETQLSVSAEQKKI
ncbi:hypothetical protein MXB_4348, partial [Myxobolus squamalis]